MALKVIGAGFGRTGTLSLKGALEELGFGPCHHMAEVLGDPGQLALWAKAARGGRVDWDQVFNGYSSCVDWPSAYFWRELANHYPDAKVVLSIRDADAWYDSMKKTILRVLRHRDTIENPHIRATMNMGADILVHHFGTDLPERKQAIAGFNAHVEAVRTTIPANRLLEFDVRQGWAPLCAHLGVPIPDTPFPNLNDAAQFAALVGER